MATTPTAGYPCNSASAVRTWLSILQLTPSSHSQPLSQKAIADQKDLKLTLQPLVLVLAFPLLMPE